MFVTALTEFFAYRDKGLNLMGHSVDLHLDYEFWIRTAIRWLFVKAASNKWVWSEAVRAYNGAGQRAMAYRDRVMARVGSTSPLFVGND